MIVPIVAVLPDALHTTKTTQGGVQICRAASQTNLNSAGVTDLTRSLKLTFNTTGEALLSAGCESARATRATDGAELSAEDNAHANKGRKQLAVAHQR